MVNIYGKIVFIDFNDIFWLMICKQRISNVDVNVSITWND